jgi:hypothetical protein
MTPGLLDSGPADFSHSRPKLGIRSKSSKLADRGSASPHQCGWSVGIENSEAAALDNIFRTELALLLGCRDFSSIIQVLVLPCTPCPCDVRAAMHEGDGDG